MSNGSLGFRREVQGLRPRAARLAQDQAWRLSIVWDEQSMDLQMQEAPPLQSAWLQ